MDSTLDYELLTRMAAQLEGQAAAAKPKQARLLQRAIELIRKTVPAPQVSRRHLLNWPPQALLKGMLQTGLDTWIGELLGCNRESVRWQRKALGVKPFTRGGDIHLRLSDKAAWFTEWRPRLQESGWQTSSKEAG